MLANAARACAPMTTPRSSIPFRVLAASFVALALFAYPLAAAEVPAADTPPKAIDLVVPFPAGGGAEFVARQIHDALGRSGGPRLTVVSRPGDGGTLGAEQVAKAAPDGTTLLLGSLSSLVFGPAAHGRPPFNPLTDFEPVAIVATVPRLILVHPSVPATTIDALIRLARADPAAVPCGTSDSLSEHAIRTFSRMSGVALDCVAYDGVAPALRQDLLSGKLRLAIESALLPDVQAGRLRALAVAGPAPLRALPAVPTASEAGMPAFDMSVWVGVFAPPGTPPAITTRLADAIAKALEDAETHAVFQKRGYVVRVLTGRALRTFLENDQRDQTRQPPNLLRRSAAPE
jgi:tripartite-type tricarboxylate transporter receptor subunit TctC